MTDMANLETFLVWPKMDVFFMFFSLIGWIGPQFSFNETSLFLGTPLIKQTWEFRNLLIDNLKPSFV